MLWPRSLLFTVQIRPECCLFAPKCCLLAPIPSWDRLYRRCSVLRQLPLLGQKRKILHLCFKLWIANMLKVTSFLKKQPPFQTCSSKQTTSRIQPAQSFWCFCAEYACVVCFLTNKINRAARDGNFYFRKTSLCTGFGACDCLFESRCCFQHFWNWVTTINWIGQKGSLQFIGSLGHYFTPGEICKGGRGYPFSANFPWLWFLNHFLIEQFYCLAIAST